MVPNGSFQFIISCFFNSWTFWRSNLNLIWSEQNNWQLHCCKIPQFSASFIMPAITRCWTCKLHKLWMFVIHEYFGYRFTYHLHAWGFWGHYYLLPLFSTVVQYILVTFHLNQCCLASATCRFFYLLNIDCSLQSLISVISQHQRVFYAVISPCSQSNKYVKYISFLYC